MKGLAHKRNGVALLGVVLLLGCDSPPAELPFGPVQLMMANEVQPTAEIYWGAVKFESELVDGEVVEREIRPQTDEEWAAVEASAVRLGELGEALLSPAYADGRGEEWTDFAQGLIDISEQARQAAASRDPDAVFEVGGHVYNVCTACHQVYPPAELEEGTTVDDLPAQ